MSESINWDQLEKQYFADGNYRERLAKMVTVVDESFLAGKTFVKNYNRSISNLNHDIKEISNDRVSTSIEHQSDKTNSKGKIWEIYRQIEELNNERKCLPTNGSPPNEKPNEKTKTDPIDPTKINWWEREVLQFMRGK